MGSKAGVGWCRHYLGWIAIAENDYEDAERSSSVPSTRRDRRRRRMAVATRPAALRSLTALLGESGQALRLAGEAVTAARPFSARPARLWRSRAAETAVLADDTHGRQMLVELLSLLHDLGTRSGPPMHCSSSPLSSSGAANTTTAPLPLVRPPRCEPLAAKRRAGCGLFPSRCGEVLTDCATRSVSTGSPPSWGGEE